jgi:hypothetical protein
MLRQIIIPAFLMLAHSSWAIGKKSKFDVSLLTSFSYNFTSKALDINQAYGASFTFRNLYMMGETKFSLRSDYFQESWKTAEGSFSVAVDRKIFREWAILTNPVNQNFLIGTGLALGFSQSAVDTNIQGESFKSYGTPEPLWGLMVNGQYDIMETATDKIFIETIVRKIFANNYVKGERNEFDLGIGIKF